MRDGLTDKAEQALLAPSAPLVDPKFRDFIAKNAPNRLPEVDKLEQDLQSQRRWDNVKDTAETAVKGALAVADAPRAAFAPAVYAAALPNVKYEYGLTGEEALKQAGFGEGVSASDIAPGLYDTTGQTWYKPNKGGMFDPSGRASVGFAMDLLADPLTWASSALKGGTVLAKKFAPEVLEKLASMAGRVSKATPAPVKFGAKVADTALRPSEMLTGYAAEKVYSRPFKDLGLDTITMRKGKGRFSKAKMEQGWHGSEAGLLDEIENTVFKAERDTRRISSRADIEGAKKGIDTTIPLHDIVFQRASELEDLAQLPSQRAAATKARDLLLEYMGGAFPDARVSLKDATKAKGDIYNLIKTWDAKAVTPTAKVETLLKETAGDLRKAVEDKAGQVLGKKQSKLLAEKNRQWGMALDVQKKVRDVAAKDRNLMTPTARDIMAGLAGMGIGAATGSTAIAGGTTGVLINKLLQYANTMHGGTNLGLMLKRGANVAGPVSDAYYRRKMIESYLYPQNGAQNAQE